MALQIVQSVLQCNIQTLNFMKLWVGKTIFALADVVISKIGVQIKMNYTYMYLV